MDITISKNRYLQGKGVKTLQAVAQEWNVFIKDFEKPCLSNLSFYSYSSYLTEFYNLEDKERLSDNEKDRRKELKGYIDSLKFHGGYYFGGTFESNTRGNAVTSKSLITLDIDNISPDIDFLDLVQNNSFLKPYEYIIHSTAKHFPKHQRYRLIIPLEEALTEDIALKYECIARHVANTIMDISKFDKTAFDDTHLMLYPVIAQDTPPKYYTYYHNETNNFLNSLDILSQYNYHDRYTFVGVERPTVQELPPTPQKLYNSSSDLITSRDKDNLRIYIAQELQENNISVPDVTSTKKFGCVCGSSDACNFGRGYVCNCFSSNHDSRLGKRGNGVYTYDIFDLYAYTHNLDTSRDFIKICYELSRKYNITLENSEQVERFLYKPTAIDGFQGVRNNTTVAHHNGNGNNSTSSNVPEWYNLLRISQKGNIISSLHNIKTILQNDDTYKGKIEYNELTNMRTFNRTDWEDVHESMIKLYLEEQYNLCVSVENINHVCNIIEYNNRYHPIREHLSQLKWDGIPRVNTVFSDFLGAKNDIYTQKVASITFIGAVARIFQPGIKYDTCTVFVGRQGLGKSKFISKLAINQDWFTDGVTTFDGKEFYESIQGKWLVELGEGTAFQKSIKERSKQAIASQQDSYRKPYARNPITLKRQCIFFGTTNNYDFLKDETGDRRYYPIDVDRRNATKNMDTELTPKYVNQLWAEALERYKQGEEIYITDGNILTIAEQEQRNHFDENPLQSDIYNFLDILLPPPQEWYSMTLEQRKIYIQAVQSGEDTLKSLRRASVYRRDRVSIKEIMCELYGYELNQPIERKISLDISRSLTALGWHKTGKAERINPYGLQRIFKSIL